MFHRLIVIGAVCALLIGALAPAALAGKPKALTSDRSFERLSFNGHTNFKPAMLDQSKKVTVIVQLSGKPLAVLIAEAKAKGGSLTKAQQAKIIRDLKAAQAPTITRAKALGATLRSTYQTVYNGFSVRIARGQLAQLSKLPGVQGVFSVGISKPDNERSVPYIGAPAVWDDLGLTGAGVKIGVIDTGIDYYHANFGGSGIPADFAADNGLTIGTAAFPNAKVAGGTDFVGDDYDANVAGSTPAPDPDPLDCNGHGSHTAGTAAGYGVLSTGATFSSTYDSLTISGNTWNIGPGVAPEATLYAYRVFGCEGSVENDIVVDAIDTAVADGMDVVNMSLGSPFGGPAGPEQDSIEAAAGAGTLVVASAGNSGPSAYIAGSPASADHALSVAAIDGGYALIPIATIDVANVGTLANNNNSSALPVNNAQVAVLPDGNGGVSLGCDESEYAGTAGKIVVTLRGTCARVDRAIFGQNAGAAAVIMINSSSSLPPFEGPINGVTIPFLGAAGTTAVTNALIGANGTTHTIIAAGTIANPSYKLIASFSSGGPRNGDSAVKPDVAAPGVSTLSTGMGTGTEGATLSGTSMAAPHATGVAALVAEGNPTWSPDAIKAAIMNTASVDASVLGNTTSRRVNLVGAGLVQPRSAAETLVYATTGPGLSSLNFGYEPLGGAYTESIEIVFHNTDSSAHSFDLSNAFQSAQGAALGFDVNPVNVPAGGQASVEATLSLSASAVAALAAAETSNFGSLSTIRGVVTATPNPGGTGLYDLRIPYLLAPRGLSNVTAGSPTAYTLDAPTATASRTASLSNAGIHAGTADVYSWGATDGVNAGLGATDVRNVGVQSLPGAAFGAPDSDRGLVFAINVGGQWSNAATNEYDIAIDNNGDGKTDYYVIGVDFGIVTAGAFDGRMTSFIFKVNKNGSLSLVDFWVATAPMNGSILELPTLASEIGLTSSMKNTAFKYQVVSFQIFDGNGFDVVSPAAWDSHRPPTSTGDYIGINPSGADTLTMTADITRFKVVKTLGWLVVSLDDANGTAQADTIAIGTLPKTK